MRWRARTGTAVLPLLKKAVLRSLDLISVSQTRHMPVQTEVQNLVLVWVQDREILELIREFLGPLGYRVEFAVEASIAGQAAG